MNVRIPRRAITYAAAVLVMTLAGCNAAKKASPESKRFATRDGLIELVVPDNWRKSTDSGPYDLQCVSNDERMATNVFEFKREDLSTSSTPSNIFQAQIADLRSKRKKFEVVEPEKSTQNADKTLTSVVYSGEKEVSRYYYRFTLIESTADPSVFAVVIQTSTPSEWAANKPVLEGITGSSRVGAPSTRIGP